MEWSSTSPQSSEGSTSPPPSQSSSALPVRPRRPTIGLEQLRTARETPKFSLVVVKDGEKKVNEWYAFQITENTNDPVNNNELPRTSPEGFAPFTGEPFHCNSTNTPILKPNFIYPEANGRHCSAIGTSSNFYRIPGQTLIPRNLFQFLSPSNLAEFHSLNPIASITNHNMPIKVKDSHPIFLSGNLYCLGGYRPYNWACYLNTTTERWILIPNPPYLPTEMSLVFTVGVERPNPFIVVGYKDPKNQILQLFDVSTKKWSTTTFKPNLNGQILNPPTVQPVAVDSRFFWYDAEKQWVVGYNPFSGECYLASLHTHDHGDGDSQPRLAFISGGDDGSLYFCLQWLSPTMINASPLVKFHCLKFLLACNRPPSGSTTFLDCKVLACQTFLVWGRKSSLDSMVGTGRLGYLYLSHERQLEN